MSYALLSEYAGIVTERDRLIAYAQYYRALVIHGLHFVHFVPASNAIALCTPRCQTHPEATAYLLLRKHARFAINTVRFEANNLKKFLDFLLLWSIDLHEADLAVLLGAFADYLRLLPRDVRPRNVLEWTLLDRVPLHPQAQTAGQLSHVDHDRTGRLRLTSWSLYSDQMLQRMVATAVAYLHFLQTRTSTYADLRLRDLPIKERSVRTFLSGTLGALRVQSYDVQALTQTGKRTLAHGAMTPLPPDALFTAEQLERFFQSISNAQDCLLFSLLRCLGLRAGEAAGLQIDPASLPPALLHLEMSVAKAQLRTTLAGDIRFIPVEATGLGRARAGAPTDGYWWCTIVDRGAAHYRASYKSGAARDVPWLPHFRQSVLLHLLYEALRERACLLAGKEDHGYLFVSRDHKARGKPLTGASVARKYDYLAARLAKDGDSTLLRFSPHTFRHYYATYLLRVLQVPIDDVSRWLGHRSTETTRTIYAHWMPYAPDQEADRSVAAMAARFSKHLGDDR